MNWNERIEGFCDRTLKDIPTGQRCVTNPGPRETPPSCVSYPLDECPPPCRFLVITQRIKAMAVKQTTFFRSRVTNPRETWAKWAVFAQWVANKLIPGLNNHIRRAADLLPLPHYPLRMPSPPPQEEGSREGGKNPPAHVSTHTEATGPCTAPAWTHQSPRHRR